MSIMNAYISRMFQSLRRHNHFLKALVPLMFVFALVGWVLLCVGSNTSAEVSDRVTTVAKVVLSKTN